MNLIKLLAICAFFIFSKNCLADSDHFITFVNKKDHDIQLGGPEIVQRISGVNISNQISRCMRTWDAPKKLITIKPGEVYTTQIRDKDSQNADCMGKGKVNSYVVHDDIERKEQYIQWVHEKYSGNPANGKWATTLGLCSLLSLSNKWDGGKVPCGISSNVSTYYPASDWELPSGSNSTDHWRIDDGSVSSTVVIYIHDY